jgi:hypothetical protein
MGALLWLLPLRCTNALSVVGTGGACMAGIDPSFGSIRQQPNKLLFNAGHIPSVETQGRGGCSRGTGRSTSPFRNAVESAVRAIRAITEADKFKTYAAAWRDRWNSSTELFMAGGNYPNASPTFPKDFAAAVQAACWQSVTRRPICLAISVWKN